MTSIKRPALTEDEVMAAVCALHERDSKGRGRPSWSPRAVHYQKKAEPEYVYVGIVAEVLYVIDLLGLQIEGEESS